jgi:SNF2 family DNA or RNA helicase
MITKQDIINFVGETIYEESKKHLEQIEFMKETKDVKKSRILINGQINEEHSYESIFSQSLYIKTGTLEINQKKITGFCTCKLKYHCPHLAAILIHYVEINSNKLLTPSSQDKNYFQHWLYDIKTAIEENERKELKPKTFKIFFLADVYEDEKLSISLEKRRILKRGGYGSADNISISNKRSVPKYITGDELEIYHLLKNITTVSFQFDIFLTGINGRIALERMIELQQLKFKIQDEYYLVTKGDTKRGILNWKKLPNGAYRLGVIFDNQNTVFIRGLDKNYYFAQNTMEIGLVEGIPFYGEETHSLVFDNFPVHQDVLTEFSNIIENNIPNIPPLISEEDQQINVNPIPHLMFNVQEGELSFKYSHFLISSKNRDNDLNRFDDIIIVRKRDKEEEFIKALEEFGFTEQMLEIEDDDIYDNDMYDLQELEDFFSVDYAFTEKILPKISKESTSHSGLFQIDRGDNHVLFVEKWRHFLKVGIPKLEKEGWIIKFENDIIPFSFDEVDLDGLDFQIKEGADWFSMKFLVDIGGQKIDLALVIQSFLEMDRAAMYANTETDDDKLNIPTKVKNKFIRIDKSFARPLINTVLKIYNKKEKIPDEPNDEIDEEDLIVSKAEAHTLELPKKLEKILSNKHKAIFKLTQRLKEFKTIEIIDTPKSLNASLRQYQKEGLSWLNFLRMYNFGGILADDMGLGKTIQTLAFLLNEKLEKRLTKPVLIVVPTSLLGNWKRECEKFTPDLKIDILHKSNRKKIYQILESETSEANNYELLVTTYGLIPRDIQNIINIKFYYIILDEAQKIKNPKAKITQNLKFLQSQYRLCLTGTPMENHLGELWSLFSFLMPTFLYKETEFNKIYRNPIEKDKNNDQRDKLKHRIKPFILRRNKSEVAKELPPKVEILQRVTFDQKQTKFYESIRVTMEKKVRETITKNGLAKSQIAILDALLKLRQVCCDPSLVKIDEAQNIEESAKLDALFDLLGELFHENRKVLLFSQFTSMLEIIEKRLNVNKINFAKLTGATRNRDEEIENFKLKETQLFLISLKAGGVGLNLTEADTVIIYDPWWNPAVENQAIDRAYRIGQDRKVFVYRFIVEGSVEEKIIELQEKKKNLTESLLSENSESFKITQEDIKDLFAPIK